jgi:hypothetical protein
MIYNWSQWNSINESITTRELDLVEDYADKLFKELGLDVEFSKHFRERVNDPRNSKPITPAELIGLFKRAYSKSGKEISEMPPSAEAVIQDMRTDLNTPFVIEYDTRTGELDLVMKTIMRKKGFQTTNDKIVIESAKKKKVIINAPSFSIRDKAPGDIVTVNGQPVTIAEFTAWTKNKEASCISFKGILEDGIVVNVKYDDGKDGYVFFTPKK